MSENAVTGWDVLDSAHRALRSAALGMGPDDGERPTPCEQWTVTQVLQHAAGDQLAWAAAITGGPSPLTPALAEPLHAAATQIVEPLRGFAYASPLGPQPGDDDIAALLHYLGRRPDWTG